VPLLPAVDLAAAAMFRTTRFAFVAEGAKEVEEFQEGLVRGMLWVAVDPYDRPVGYALARPVDDTLFVDELAVDPAHGRRGLGTRLIDAVSQWARSTGYPAVTLSTFRDVAWNAPYYQQRGFRILDSTEFGPGLQAVRAADAQNGLPVDERVIMRREIQG
jgi:GNAT superfamily N-acetyltransferase